MSNLVKGKAPAGNFEARVVPPHKSATIIIDRASYDQMMYFVRNNPIECMWYCRISAFATSRVDAVAWYVSGIYIPKQIAAAAEVETTPEGMTEMWKSIRTDLSLSAADLNTLMQSAKVWCHSHVDMAPIPSTVDDKQWAEMIDYADRSGSSQPIAMIILNRKEEYTNRVYDPVTKCCYTCCPIVLDDPTDYTYVEDAIKNKVAKREPPKTHSPNPHSWTGPSLSTQGPIVAGTRNPTTSSPNPSTSTSPTSSGGNHTYKYGETSVTLNWLPKELPKESKYDDEANKERWYTPLRELTFLKPETLPVVTVLEDLAKMVFPEDDTFKRLGKLVQPLNSISPRETDSIKKNVDAVLDFLSEITDAPRNLWIRYLSMTLTLERAIAASGSSEDLANQILQSMEMFKGTTETITDFFACDYVVHPQLTLFGIAITYLLERGGKKVQLGEAVTALKDLIDVTSEVYLYTDKLFYV